MKPLAEWTEVDLRELIGTQEGQSIDFKRSDSIDLTTPDKDKRVKELVKDVSAMANAAGGRIFYGVAEEQGTGRAERLDDGLEAASFNLDQIGNLLTGNIEPSIPGVKAYAVPLANGRFAIVIDVPQSMNGAPHQSRLDRVYHRRHDRKTLAMFDHEIRDVMRRAVSPQLSPTFTVSRTTYDQPYHLEIGFVNKSTEPAMFYVVDVGIDSRVKCEVVASGWNKVDAFHAHSDKHLVTVYQRAFLSPNAVPLFKPRSVSVWNASFYLPEGERYRLYLQISCAGFHETWDGYMWAQSEILQFDIEPKSGNPSVA